MLCRTFTHSAPLPPKAQMYPVLSTSFCGFDLYRPVDLPQHGLFFSISRSRVYVMNAMKTYQSLSRLEIVLVQWWNFAVTICCCIVTHLGSGRTGGSRLANVPSAEGLMTVVCCYLVTVSGLVSATRMMSLAFPLSYCLRLSIDH